MSRTLSTLPSSIARSQAATDAVTLLRSNDLVVAHLMPTSRFVACAGAVVAVSEGVQSRLTTHTAVAETLSRAITAPTRPQFYFSEFWTAASSGSVYLGAPRGLQGEMTVLNIGEPTGRELIVKRNSFVAAAGENVVIKAELNSDGLSAYRIYNSGSVAIAAPTGSIHNVSLSVNEEIYVDPKMLVAWDAGVRVQATSTNEADTHAAAKVEPAPVFAGANIGDQVAAMWTERFKRVGTTVWESMKFLGKLVLWKGKQATVLNKGMYRLTGPGELYLASRRLPTLSWFARVPPAVFRSPKSSK
ncbi:mitochondrial biogenesis protein AIM24 [Chytriomyces cf. hyalinus JEL632]|nr:mitochondrial biogenesis protein AIM24 [Chytriomyces cf. hyalinus JEL632]